MSVFPNPARQLESLETTVAESTVTFSSENLSDLEERITDLQRQEQILKAEIDNLKAVKAQILQDQITQVQTTLSRLIQESTSELERRKHTLQIAVEQLERRQERIQAEMRSSFAGTSQELAIRVQGFKDYLVGSLQDLAAAAEQLPLVPPQAESEVYAGQEVESSEPPPRPKFAERGFQEEAAEIQALLDRYRSQPDYYGPSWQLRRTFEPIHAESVSNWFFLQGGRGALKSLGTRLQNILVASAVISILYELVGDRLRVLVLASTPERLGEWRRGLQDCLGVSRSDFGPERGVTLFEAPEPLVQKAERLVEADDLPLILVDETEEKISLGILQFPLWLAFAPDPQAPTFL